MIKELIKNPLSIWFYRLIMSEFLKIKYRNKKLNVNRSAYTRSCDFGFYNTLYECVELNEVCLGDFSYIATHTKISKTRIGKFCSIGPDCKIGLGRHPSNTFVSTHPIFYSELKQAQITFADRNYFSEFEDIVIGNDVWIGANVIVMDGVKISDGVIVAAGSVVTKDIPPYAIVGGVPAKVIKYRFKDNEIEKLMKLKWWDKDIDYLKNNYKKFHNIENLMAEVK